MNTNKRLKTHRQQFLFSAQLAQCLTDAAFVLGETKTAIAEQALIMFLSRRARSMQPSTPQAARLIEWFASERNSDGSTFELRG